MAQAYTSPGVRVIETSNPALVPTLGTLSRIAIVGPAAGLESASERLILSGSTAVTLANTGVSTGSVVVKLAATGETIDDGNYIVTQSSDPDATVTGDEIYTIARDPHPTSAPTAAATGTGTLTGTYSYAVSFVNARGETGIGPESGTVSPSNQGINLSNIPVGGAGVTGRNIYRKKTVASGGDGKFHLVATINDNVTTTYSNESTLDGTAQAAPEPVTGIADGASIVLTYNYTDDDYYEPTLFDDWDDLVDKYGEPFDADGNVSSALSFSARFAFANGANEVVAVATTGTSSSAYSTALDKLKENESVGFVVVASGDAAVHTLVASHVNAMNAEGMYRIGIIGRDGSTTPILATTLRSAAESFNNEAILHLSPAAFGFINRETGREMAVGGQYAAAAIAGMLASRDAQVPLTRKTISDFSSLKDKRTESERQQDSASGLLVIEDRGGILRVRHGLSTAVGNVNTREVSVVRSKYEMARRIRDTIDRSVIGHVAPLDEVPEIVRSVVTAVLEQVRVEGLITGYENVKSRTLQGDPTTVEVRFEYVPAYPINTVEVRFRINTESGIFSLAA